MRNIFQNPEKSIAAKLIIATGMLIVSVDRKDVSTVDEFNEALEESAEDKKVMLLIRNDRYAQYVMVPLD